jgi:hypothetical protein
MFDEYSVKETRRNGHHCGGASEAMRLVLSLNDQPPNAVDQRHLPA